MNLICSVAVAATVLLLLLLLKELNVSFVRVVVRMSAKNNSFVTSQGFRKQHSTMAAVLSEVFRAVLIIL